MGMSVGGTCMHMHDALGFYDPSPPMQTKTPFFFFFDLDESDCLWKAGSAFCRRVI
jgi:hypothetical protein